MSNSEMAGYKGVGQEDLLVLRSPLVDTESVLQCAPKVNLDKYHGPEGLVGVVRRSAAMVMARSVRTNPQHSELNSSRGILRQAFTNLNLAVSHDKRMFSVGRDNPEHPTIFIGAFDIKREIDRHWVDPEPQLLPLSDWSEKLGTPPVNVLFRNPDIACHTAVGIEMLITGSAYSTGRRFHGIGRDAI